MNNHPREVPRSVVAELSNLDFGCDFNNGRCKESRERVNHGVHFEKKGCCYSCASAVGHFIRIRKIDLSEYKKRFDKELGFWRRNKGCILPRTLRSQTCQFHTCSQNKKLHKKLQKLQNRCPDFQYDAKFRFELADLYMGSAELRHILKPKEYRV